MISRIDLTRPSEKAKLELCRPDLDRTVIARLNDAYQLNYKLTYGNINTLSFSLPYEKDVERKLKRNKNADLLRPRYIIKLTRGSYVEYYIIDKITDTMEDDKDYKKIECFSLGHELTTKLITTYTVTSKNCSFVLHDMLSSSIWNIGYVNAQFDTKYRSFDFNNMTALEAIQEVAATFNAVIKWDTINRSVSFYKDSDLQQDTGFLIAYGRLMQNVSQETNFDDVCTRLKVFGNDDLSIQSVNPTGSNYVEDYSYFIYPFQRDVNRNVLSHSDYMSDSLCHALLDYKELVASKQTIFNGYLTTKTNYQNSLTNKQNELHTLQDQLAIIEDNLSVANANNQSTSGLISQKNAKLTEISVKNGEIVTLNGQITTVNNQISTLGQTLSIANNFTTNQVKEWNQFIIEKVWSDSNYTSAQELYDEGKRQFDIIREPKLIVSVSIVNFYEMISEQSYWDRLNIGDLVVVRHEKLGININAKVMEIAFNEENSDISLTISNAKEILSNQERFYRDMYRSVSTSATVDTSKYKWDDAVSNVNDVQEIINGVQNAAERSIVASNNETVEINRKGIRTYDLNDPNKVVVIQHGTVALSNTGGNTWNTVMNASGVYAERLVGTILAGTNLTITTNNGNFLVNNTGVTIKDLTLSVTRSDSKSRLLLDPTNGLKIQKNTGTVGSPVWVDSIAADVNGDLSVTGNINATSGTFTGTVNANSGTFSGNITATGTITGGTISGASFNFGSLSATNINGGTITGSILQTSATGQRVRIDASGFRAYGSNGQQRIGITNDMNNFSEIVVYDSNGIDRGYISADSTGLTIEGNEVIHLAGMRVTSPTIDISGSLIVNGDDVMTKISNLQSQINSLASQLANKSNVGHTHNVSIPNHNHGNPDNLNSGGGTFTTTT